VSKGRSSMHGNEVFAFGTIEERDYQKGGTLFLKFIDDDANRENETESLTVDTELLMNFETLCFRREK
jgi:hypothetical protein